MEALRPLPPLADGDTVLVGKSKLLATVVKAVREGDKAVIVRWESTKKEEEISRIKLDVERVDLDARRRTRGKRSEASGSEVATPPRKRTKADEPAKGVAESSAAAEARALAAGDPAAIRRAYANEQGQADESSSAEEDAGAEDPPSEPEGIDRHVKALQSGDAEGKAKAAEGLVQFIREAYKNRAVVTAAVAANRLKRRPSTNSPHTSRNPTSSGHSHDPLTMSFKALGEAEGCGALLAAMSAEPKQVATLTACCTVMAMHAWGNGVCKRGVLLADGTPAILSAKNGFGIAHAALCCGLVASSVLDVLVLERVRQHIDRDVLEGPNLLYLSTFFCQLLHLRSGQVNHRLSEDVRDRTNLPFGGSVGVLDFSAPHVVEDLGSIDLVYVCARDLQACRFSKGGHRLEGTLLSRGNRKLTRVQCLKIGREVGGVELDR